MTLWMGWAWWLGSCDAVEETDEVILGTAEVGRIINNEINNN